ncbi:unnamed protein product [Ascophyllum nodosum]
MVNVRRSGKSSGGDYSRSSCGIEGYRRRETCPTLSTEETFFNSTPSSGVKRKSVHHSLDIESGPSNGSVSSYKRARQMDIASVTSSRGVAGESAAGAVTIPVVDKQQLHSPVTRDSSVKTEVQLSL